MKQKFILVVFLFLLIIPFINALSVLNTTAHYKFDNSTIKGTLVYDTLGLNNCTLSGTPSVNQTGWILDSVNFTSGKGKPANNWNGGDISILAMINLNQKAGGTNGNLISDLSGGVAGKDMDFGVGYGSGAKRDIYFLIQSDGSNYATKTANINLLNNTWYSVALTRSGAEVRIYLNGVRQVLTNSTTGNPFGSYPYQPTIGDRFDVTTYNFGGLIDEYWQVERQLTDAEIVEWNSTMASKTTYPFIPQGTYIFQNKTPVDINETNVVVNNLIINYNFTPVINQSNAKIYFKTNSTLSDCMYFVNGVSYCGYFSKNYSANTSTSLMFNLTENNVYPATYNMQPELMDTVQNINISVGSNNAFVKNRFFNVSANNSILNVEMMVTNLSAAPLHLWICNSSYTTGSVSSSPFCTNFFDLPVQNYSHCHSQYSCHYVVPLNKNGTSLNGVGITSTLYVLYQGGTQWNYFYLANNTNSVQGTVNGGVSWTSLPVTLNSHIHQYSGNDTFYFYVSDGGSTSSLQTDNLELEKRPPSSVVIYSPVSGTYDKTNILINYSSAISSSSSILYYAIYLLNSNYTFLNAISMNNSLNLNYTINSNLTANGNYIIEVDAFDLNNISSKSYSEMFTIDNSPIVPEETTASAISKTAYLTIFILCYFGMAVLYFLYRVLKSNGTSSAFILFLCLMFLIIPLMIPIQFAFMKLLGYFMLIIFGIVVMSELMGD